MTKIGTIEFKVSPDLSYKFDVFPWGTNFKSIASVYVITERYKRTNGKITHKVIYIGQTDNLSERFDNHHKKNCFEKEGANCICIYEKTNELKRKTIEKILIKFKKPSCND